MSSKSIVEKIIEFNNRPRFSGPLSILDEDGLVEDKPQTLDFLDEDGLLEDEPMPTGGPYVDPDMLDCDI